jgi:hypothetical protein
MKRILKTIIIFLIECIEKYQYRNIKISKDENNLDDKFIDIVFPDNLSVESEDGYIKVEEINVTKPLQLYELKLENGLKLKCADNHIVICENFKEKFVTSLTKEDKVITKLGLSKVESIKKIYGKVSMFDLSVESYNQTYYTNNILSHNTVSSAIFILHTCLFSNDKGCMIVANKGKTVQEIIRKIKEIYKLLPFFLQKGVINWNEKSIAFDNGSRIHTENRTKDPSVGFTIDLLYLDEFAKVPDNIINTFYGTVVPIVSSVKNSKIIITSTPDGFNLFHQLLVDGEREEEDPLKGMYAVKRVYWWQVKGRRDVEIFPLAYKMKQYDLTKEYLIEELTKLGFNIYFKEQNRKEYICIKYEHENENTRIANIRSLRINNIPLPELALITNWQEQETKLIGGEEMFKQEYDLQFITGNKLVFNSETLEVFERNSQKFEYLDIPILNKKILLPYNNCLKWIKDKSIFDIQESKKYTMVASIDLGEGLGKDYTVLNIFRLMLKDKETIEKMSHKFNSKYDYFKLEQVGMFRSNLWSIEEFAELFYVLFFDIFNSESSKVVLEYNTYGSTLLAHLPHVFNEHNNYSSGIFFRYKHSKEDAQPKIGIKITRGEADAAKKLLVKNFQDAVNIKSLNFCNDINVKEIRMFSRKDLPSGSYTYQAESGNDDTIMTLITLSSIFNHAHYKDLIDSYILRLTFEENHLLEKSLNTLKTVDDEAINYSLSSSNYLKIYKNKNKYIPVKLSPFNR